MDAAALEKSIEQVYAQSNSFIEFQTESIVRQYVTSAMNQKVNYFIAEYVKIHLFRMMDTVWEMQFDKQVVLERLELDMDMNLGCHIDNYCKQIFDRYLHEELKKKARKIAKEMEAT